MKKDSAVPTTIDAFIGGFPQDVQEQLQTLRATIRRAAPDAEEKINYGIPTFCLNGNLVHFAAYKQHIGFYPGASGIAAFEEELENYKTSKGTVQFPLNEPLPLELIDKIVQYRVKQNLAKADLKVRTKKTGSSQQQ